jgi:hypothetical protein
MVFVHEPPDDLGSVLFLHAGESNAQFCRRYVGSFPYPKRALSPEDQAQVVDLDPAPATFAAASAP